MADIRSSFGAFLTALASLVFFAAFFEVTAAAIRVRIQPLSVLWVNRIRKRACQLVYNTKMILFTHAAAKIVICFYLEKFYIIKPGQTHLKKVDKWSK